MEYLTSIPRVCVLTQAFASLTATCSHSLRAYTALYWEEYITMVIRIRSCVLRLVRTKVRFFSSLLVAGLIINIFYSVMTSSRTRVVAGTNGASPQSLNQQQLVHVPQNKVKVSINISPNNAHNTSFGRRHDGEQHVLAAGGAVIKPARALVGVHNSSYKVLQGKLQPQEHIDCFQRITATYMAELKIVRGKIRRTGILSNVFPKGTFDKKRVVLQASSEDFFSSLEQFDFIETIMFNASMDRMKSCMLKDYFSRTTINNCSRVLRIAKRHEQYGKSLYGLTCEQDLSSTLKPSPLHHSVFDVGMPENYVQGTDVKTVMYLHVVKHCIVTRHGDVVTNTVHIIPHRCYPQRRAGLLQRANVTIEKEVFSIAQYFGGGMFHGNVEDVSRLALYVPFLRANPAIKIHVVSQPPPVFMQMLGFPSSRFVQGTIKAKVAYVPTGTGCCLPNLITTQLESFYLRRHLPNLWQQRDLIILVKRSQRRNRYFIQHTDILNMLQNNAEIHGLKVWEFMDDPVPPIQEVAAMFNRAVMLVAPHGAGETNLLFAQPGLVLIEGLCFDSEDQKINLVYRNLVHLIGGHYYGYYRPVKHCTFTTADELRGPVEFYLNALHHRHKL